MRPVEAQVRPKHSCEYAVVYTKLRLSINMTLFVNTFHSISGANWCEASFVLHGTLP